MPIARIGLEPRDFIAQRLTLTPLPFRPDIALYRPTPQSGLTRWLVERGAGDEAPYWAYAWAGGAALSLYLSQHPEEVDGRKVLDFGSGSGLVGIAAAKAGAQVLAYEPDPVGQAATVENARANGVKIELVEAPVATDIVLAGDVFYSAGVAARTLPLLERLASGGAQVLVGDPFRRDLPLDRLTILAEYRVPDMGGPDLLRAGVFVLNPAG